MLYKICLTPAYKTADKSKKKILYSYWNLKTKKSDASQQKMAGAVNPSFLI